LAAYGDLCKMRGDARNAARYTDMAKIDVQHWIKMADASDHSLLAFDKPGTWSQKYNLVWDRILGLNVFPPTVAQKEITFYKTVLQPYGLPLDSRKKITKTDWSVWSATLADNQSDFDAIVDPIYKYLDETTARDPLADSYMTNNIKSGGMHARPVVGGIFVKMLSDKATWQKWSSGDKTKLGSYAALPARATMTPIIPDSQHQRVMWRYTLEKPANGWTDPTFDDAGWKEAPAPFGSRGTPNLKVGTQWKSDDIWIRRTFTMPDTQAKDLQFVVYHDEDVQIFVNGILGAQEGGFVNLYQPMEMSATAKAELKAGAKITLAVHCHQTEGGQGVDVGLVDVVQQ
jgi:hypothetical protein